MSLAYDVESAAPASVIEVMERYGLPMAFAKGEELFACRIRSGN